MSAAQPIGVPDGPAGVVAAAAPRARPRLEAVDPGHAARAELERYVCAAFAARHGATVRSFMPTLLGLREGSGVLQAVAGVRGAHENRLYLERYLDRPVEQALAAALAARGLSGVSRREIAEVGHLAGSSCRAAVRLVALVPSFLESRRYSWIVFTATGAVQRLLGRLEAPLLELARADRARVADAADDWGRYYETDPRVYAGWLRDAHRLPAFARARAH